MDSTIKQPVNKEVALALKEDVKRLAKAGQEARGEIRRTSGMERWAAWQEKRLVGYDARVSLLAYACVRGRPYRSVEPKTHDDLTTFEGIRLMRHVQKTLAAFDGTWSEEQVIAWMKAPLPEPASKPEATGEAA
jgi:hypothetical protein